MFYAKAMYKGGMIVCANDTNLNYSSYLKEGLRCLVCGEEVYLRKGDSRKPHFAHFHVLTSSQYECPLRVMGYSDAWSQLTPEGQGQRRKIFQKNFLRIIAQSTLQFFEKNAIVKATISEDQLNIFIKKCYSFFEQKKIEFFTHCRILPKNHENNLIFKNIIASEAIDYLCTSTSYGIFEKLTNYALFQDYKRMSEKSEIMPTFST
jgi:Competence protein CoiA-like family